MDAPAVGAIIALAVISLMALIRLFGRGDQDARIDQLPAVVAQLRATGKNESFAVFRFAGPGETLDDAHALELQYSIDESGLGLDWCLLAPRNIADKDKIAAFIRERGHAVNEHLMNEVSFLRVEDGDLAQLGIDIACAFYGLAPNAAVSLIVDGFDWPAKDSN